MKVQKQESGGENSFNRERESQKSGQNEIAVNQAKRDILAA